LDAARLVKIVARIPMGDYTAVMALNAAIDSLFLFPFELPSLLLYEKPSLLYIFFQHKYLFDLVYSQQDQGEMK
jgi:hypothetical protein